MRYVAVALCVGGVLAMVRSLRTSTIAERVERYLAVVEDESSKSASRRLPEGIVESVPWVVAGSLVGVLLAQGDLFIGDPGGSIVGLGLLGGAAGWFLRSAHETNKKERTRNRLRDELPAIVDAISMQIVSGESVVSAVRNIANEVEGVGSAELRALIERADEIGFVAALAIARDESAADEAKRLYDLLEHAHMVGGRLGESLTELSSDLRASLERDLTTESGRRAVATYGPVLALMVPTALLFLLYPTILGLRALSGVP